MEPKEEALDKLISFARKLMVEQRGGQTEGEPVAEAEAPIEAAPEEEENQAICSECGMDMAEGACPECEGKKPGLDLTIIKAGRLGGKPGMKAAASPPSAPPKQKYGKRSAMGLV